MPQAAAIVLSDDFFPVTHQQKSPHGASWCW